MSRSTFLGHESLGPDEVSPTVPGDSPRHHGNRNDGAEQAADRVLSKLTARLARDPDGHVVRVSRDQPLKAGWIAMGPAPERVSHNIWIEPARIDPITDLLVPAKEHRVSRGVPVKALTAKNWLLRGPDLAQPTATDIDSEQDREIYGSTRRDGMLAQLDAEAHELRVGSYRANRPAFYDGGELVIPKDNDRDVATTKHPDAFDANRARKDRR